MKFEFREAPEDAPLARIYIAAATLEKFRNKNNVEIQLFRIGVDNREVEILKKLNLVDKNPGDLPEAIIAQASEDAALECLLETFTKAEVDRLAQYLQNRYGDLVTSLTACPIDLPVPLGVGPLAKIPEGKSSGFINFDLAPDYPLDFAFRGYYDLEQA